MVKLYNKNIAIWSYCSVHTLKGTKITEYFGCHQLSRHKVYNIFPDQNFRFHGPLSKPSTNFSEATRAIETQLKRLLSAHNWVKSCKTCSRPVQILRRNFFSISFDSRSDT